MFATLQYHALLYDKHVKICLEKTSNVNNTSNKGGGPDGFHEPYLTMLNTWPVSLASCEIPFVSLLY